MPYQADLQIFKDDARAHRTRAVRDILFTSIVFKERKNRWMDGWLVGWTSLLHVMLRSVLLVNKTI